MDSIAENAARNIMLHRQRQVRNQIHKLLDALIIGVSFWLAYFVRSHSIGVRVFTFELGGFSEYAWLLAFIVPFAPLVLELNGFYDRSVLGSRRIAFWQLLKGCSVLTVGAIIIQFFFREQLARSVYIFFPFFSILLVMLKEETVRQLVESQVGRSRMRRRLIIAGDRIDTEQMSQYLSTKDDAGFDVVEKIPLDEESVIQLPSLLRKYSANAVVLCAQHTAFGLVEKAIRSCELEGVEVWLMADFFKTEISQTSLDEFYGKPMLVFRSAPEASWQVMAKQVIDFVGALFLLVCSSPVLLAAALMIRFSSKGPILFKQQRAGLNGQPFNMLKFRSMVSNAEQLKQELAQLNEMSGPVFKVTNDPRVTRVGRFIRKWSIDELPQLINILLGDMSLVGPRPLPVDEVERFDDRAHRRRLSVKPGLTCLWQVTGRSDVRDFAEWVRLDLEYIDNWSIWLDLKILVRTIPVVLTGAGAK
jgi:exopolysaccharide biosynthesis polyprenyl glycosylphosphotransferase